MKLHTILLSLAALTGVLGQGGQPACDQSSCYPATGDLLIGREQRLFASSTCGLRSPERYCIVSHLEEEKKCFVCDSRQPYVPGLYTMSHRVENIVSSFLEDRKYRWWQAENGRENVFIQLDLEAEFHFTHLIMRFKTFRPSALLVERSYDFGKTWKVYRYFAHDCAEAYPRIPTGPIRNINDVICESRYSDVAPSSGGEVIFKVLPPNIEIEDPYSEEVQDLLKMTNLRLNFTKLHTLGDNLLDSRDEIKEKYYYALYDMVVRGSCSCYGHASRCKPIQGQRPEPNMVYGECECTHNTEGRNCEKCKPFYNDLPWRPAHGRETNACKMCECNSHSSRCHFDPAVYELTGRVSGGVCDDCAHNTMGRNCESCKPFFYKDPLRDIKDPYVCQACDCDPVGSEHGGECQSHDDPHHGLQAGRCICKRFVEGERCDRCRTGYWNMIPDNPDGCEPCVCNTLGTVGNLGCDQLTGDCQCKRYVTGMMCDQCLPQYWGLSNDVEGCKACDCDLGGAFDNNCDQLNGQCKCRPNIIGRRCDQSQPGYFTPHLDYYVYEGEAAIGTGNTRQVIREPVPGQSITWTGPGFMRVSEGDSLEFIVDNLPYSMEYDIIIRYEAQMGERWEDVRVTVVRPGRVDQRGPCANSIPQDDFKATSLPPGEGYGSGDAEIQRGDMAAQDNGYPDTPDQPLQRNAFLPGQRYYIVTPPSCLEKGVSYTVRIDFNRYRGDRTSPEASILIDSISLIPSIEGIPIFEGTAVSERMREEFISYGCRENQMPVTRPDDPELCKRYIFSISAIMQNQALACECDPTGSRSSVCNQHGGQCDCKPNVIGRRCDQCAPGTYGFGPAGCIACECNAIGARDNFCDPTNGQCLCLPGVYGRQCGSCQRGYYSFPNCRPCQCNGRADECDDATGQCLQCQDNTGGPHCDQCRRGFYGDPSPSSTIGCRPCMCPGGERSGYQHADTCELDFRTNQVRCHCKDGYAGIRCDRCADNYYGNPLVPGGTCERCGCNNNIDPDMPGSCDSTTGQCLRCLYNTEGFNCEVCRPGYYGDATRQNCQACVCNILGTDRSRGTCDRVTGQCPCLPNVVGQNCDRCASNYWKIASGLGCEACHCDPDGSLSTQCNEFDGQCTCRPGRGGRDCSECEANYWGDPYRQCKPCNCNVDGSETLQCDRRTGQCVCAKGVAGNKCDRCDRGTTGALPYCVPCGECFDNWDLIISELKEETDRLVNEGSNIKVSGAPGAFGKEFKDMEDKLDEVRRILAGTNVTTDDLDSLHEKLNQIKKNMTDSSNELDLVEDDMRGTTSRIETANNRIDAIKRGVDSLKTAADNLRANATNIRELDVAGAYNSTKESQRRSAAAQAKVDSTDRIIQDSQNIRSQVERLLESQQENFNRQFQENEQTARDLDNQLERLDDKIVDLNKMVCDGQGDPCDSRCGGAGCKHCGGIACGEGAVTRANNALEFAKDADDIIRSKLEQANDLRRDVQGAQDLSDMAKADAQMAYDKASEAKNQSESTRAQLEDLINRISEFLSQQGARPADIRAVADEVLGMSISLNPQEIQDLAQQIEETIRGLSDIDTILDATRDRQENARKLKQRADAARTGANEILDVSKRVIEALEAAREAQERAKSAIDQASLDIQNAQDDLTQIEKDTGEIRSSSNRTQGQMNNMKDRVEKLRRKYLENENKVQKAEIEAEGAEEKANKAEQDANDLEDSYNQVALQLETKFNQTRIAKERADSLRDRATFLYQDTYQKTDRLRSMEIEFQVNEEKLVDLSEEIKRLNEEMQKYLADIIQVATFHRTCTT